MAPPSTASRRRRVPRCQRKFSWMTRVDPAASAAATMAAASARASAMGFWQITRRVRGAATSTSARCEGGVVTMSANSGRCASSISAASAWTDGIPNSAAIASARARSVSHTATICASGRPDQACR